MQLTDEFDRQVQHLIHKGYPTLAGMSESKFTALLTPFQERIQHLDVPEVDIDKGRLPFVIVVKSEIVPTDKMMTLAEKDGKPGITKLVPLQPSDFSTIPEVHLPDSPVYLIIDIDRGKESLNKRPVDAMQEIIAQGRSPLTIDEGIALVTHYPDFLLKNNCFSLLASRHPGDKRVPAIWINAHKSPNLGWCWNGNPHTWLGSASCRERM